MACKPTYKGKRYNSLEELYRANGISNQQEQVKKFAELQERLNNKEFLEGAKSAFESSEELQNVYYEAAGLGKNKTILAKVREQNFEVYQYEDGFEAVLNKEWLNEELEENKKAYNDNVKNLENIIKNIQQGKNLSSDIDNIISDTFNGILQYDKSNNSYSIYHFPGSIGFEDFDSINETNREGESAYESISLQDIKNRLLLGFKNDLKSKNEYTNIRASIENKERIENDLQYYADTYYQYEEGRDIGGLIKKGYVVPKNKGYIIRSAGGGALNHIPGAFPAIKAYFYYEGNHQMGEEDAYVLIDKIDSSGVYIRYTTVKKELRGKGISSLLLNRIRKDYPNLPIIRTMIDNPIIVEQSRHIKGSKLTNGKPLPTFDKISFSEWQDTQYSDIYLPPLNEDNNQITPQQKQQALEAYTDYIARVSLGIIKNPSSGEYNYESQIKDIVYHGTINEFEVFEKGINGIHFTKDRNIAETKFGNIPDLETFPELKDKYNNKSKRVISAIVNVTKPTVKEDTFVFKGDRDFETESKRFREENKNVDGIEYVNKFEGGTSNSVLVFEPEQIHILGSKQDIKGFKEYVDEKLNTTIAEKLNIDNTIPIFENPNEFSDEFMNHC